MSTDPGQVYRDAAEIIKRDGWQKGTELTGAHCVLDAVAEAMGIPHGAFEVSCQNREFSNRWARVPAEAARHLQKTLGELEGYPEDDPVPVYAWNDHLPRRGYSHEEATEKAIQLLEKAATSAPVE